MIADGMGLLHDVADAVATAMRTVTDWGPSGQRVGQYALDVTADDAALEVLNRAGVGVLSEESGFRPGDTGDVVVVDPIDGSTNASRGIPWYATSLCLVDAKGPRAALVVNQASGVRYSAERGRGAWSGERRLQPSGCNDLADAIVVVSAVPPVAAGWAQFRALGACALDLCALADGVVDGYVDFGTDQHGLWGLPRWMVDLRGGRRRSRRRIQPPDAAHGPRCSTHTGRGSNTRFDGSPTRRAAATLVG